MGESVRGRQGDDDDEWNENSLVYKLKRETNNNVAFRYERLYRVLWQCVLCLLYEKSLSALFIISFAIRHQIQLSLVCSRAR
jgi:hypothetical protein